MKKIMFVMMAVAALSIASCGKADKACQASDSTTVVTDSVNADSVSVDSVAVDSIKA